MGETTDPRGARPNEESRLFQAEELERMGLLPAGDDRGTGELFVGDGVRAAQAICGEALGQENVRLDWFDGGHGTEVPRRLLTGLTWLLAK